MYARVQTGHLPPEDIETFVGMIRERVAPQVHTVPGVTGGYWLANRETGKVIGVILYESREALEASTAQAAQIRAEASRGAGLPEPHAEVYEVVETVDLGGLLAA